MYVRYESLEESPYFRDLLSKSIAAVQKQQHAVDDESSELLNHIQ